MMYVLENQISGASEDEAKPEIEDKISTMDESQQAPASEENWDPKTVRVQIIEENVNRDDYV